MQDWGGGGGGGRQRQRERESKWRKRDRVPIRRGTTLEPVGRKKRGMHWKVKEEGVMKLETLRGMQQNADGAS